MRKNIHFIFVLVLIFHAIGNVKAQTNNKQGNKYISVASLLQNGDEQISEEENDSVIIANPNNFKLGNPTNQLLQVIDINDITIVDIGNKTQSENSVFISPLDANIILNANNAFPVAFGLGVSYFISGNGGQTWTGEIEPVDFTSIADPAAVIGRSGRFHVGFVNQIHKRPSFLSAYLNQIM